MSSSRRLAPALIGSGLVLGVAGLLAYLADPWFWERLVTFPTADAVTAVEWYRPLEAVAGATRNEVHTATPERQSVARTAIAQAVAYGTQTKSVALLVWHQGALELEQYWPGYGPDSRTESGAMHATVLALLYGIAIDQGIIRSPEEPAATYLPEWRQDARARIRIRDLLQMASGLEIVAPSRNPWNRALRLFLGGNSTALALDSLPVAEPATRFEYSEFDAEILGIILQRASGKRYARFLAQQLWTPLGAGPAGVWLDHGNGMARTFCGLQATARGWLEVGLLILNEGRSDTGQIVPAAWIKQMLTPSSANRNFGLQIWLGNALGGEREYNSATRVRVRQSEPFLAPDVVYLDDGGGQRVYIIPSQQLVIVRTGARRTDWDDARLPNAILRGVS